MWLAAPRSSAVCLYRHERPLTPYRSIAVARGFTESAAPVELIVDDSRSGAEAFWHLPAGSRPTSPYLARNEREYGQLATLWLWTRSRAIQRTQLPWTGPWQYAQSGKWKKKSATVILTGNRRIDDVMLFWVPVHEAPGHRQ